MFHYSLRSHRAQAMACISENTHSQGNLYFTFFWLIFVSFGIFMFFAYWKCFGEKLTQKLIKRYCSKVKLKNLEALLWQIFEISLFGWSFDFFCRKIFDILFCCSKMTNLLKLGDRTTVALLKVFWNFKPDILLENTRILLLHILFSGTQGLIFRPRASNMLTTGPSFGLIPGKSASIHLVKSSLSGLRKILATESSLKVIKNAFYFYHKALFVLKILKFMSGFCSHVEKWLDLKNKVNFKIHDVTTWLTNICNTHLAHYLEN